MILRHAVLISIALLSGCGATEQDVAACQLDTDRAFPGKTAEICGNALLGMASSLIMSGKKDEGQKISDVCHDAGGHMDLCMRSRGYSFSAAHAQCQPAPDWMYNRYCYQPTDSMKKEIWNVQVKLSKK